MIATMPSKGDGVNHESQQAGDDETLDGVNVAGQSADKFAGLLLRCDSPGQVLNMGIQEPPQVMHHPLSHAGSQILFGIKTDGIQEGDAR